MPALQVVAGVNPNVALYVDGAVFEDRLPSGHRLDAAAKADMPTILYRKVVG